MSPLVCATCHTLFSSPEGTDYYDLLGIERCYNIDESLLTTAYRALARNIHPDRFAGQGENVGRLATHLSATLNEAMAVLKDPLRRANYLLERAGGPSAIEVREVPGDLLTEVMMLREQIDEARAAGDGATLARVRASLLDRRTQALARVASLADALATADAAAKRDYRKLLNSIRYFDNLLAQLPVDPLAEALGGRNE